MYTIGTQTIIWDNLTIEYSSIVANFYKHCNFFSEKSCLAKEKILHHSLWIDQEFQNKLIQIPLTSSHLQQAR